MRVDTQPAYVLHSRNYRDSSLILELWTPEYGRMAAVARGARSPGRRAAQVYLQAFAPLLVSWTGRSSLKTLTGREARGQRPPLKGERLFSGLYINELLVRLFPHEDPHPELYGRYEALLDYLRGSDDLEPALREFELQLLDEMGYGIQLAHDAERDELVDSEIFYCYIPELGMVRSCERYRQLPKIRGSSLLAMSAGVYDQETRQSAKLLLRQALSVQLGDKPLNSRNLFT